MRNGQVSATLDILSVDLKTKTVVFTRNSQAACPVQTDDGADVRPGAERPLGSHPRPHPWASEIPVWPSLRVILVSDGIANSGGRAGLQPLDLAMVSPMVEPDATAAEIADLVLAEAIGLDEGKPSDDMSIIALTLPEQQETTLVRRMRADAALQ